MTKDNNINVTTALIDIFHNVNSWLKFAEAKNGILLTLNSGFLWGVLNAKKNDMLDNNTIIYLICFLFLGAILICMYSFFPKVEKPYEVKGYDKPSEKDNLLFYGDIAKYPPYKYLEKLSEDLNCKETDKKLNFYYANQIIINSRLALRKYSFFVRSVKFTFGAFLLLTILFVKSVI